MALLSATAILVATLLYYGIKYDVLKQAKKLDLLGAHFILAIYTIGYALAEKKQVEIIWLNVGIFVLRVFLEFTPEYRTILGVATANIVYFTGEIHSGITGAAFGVAIAGIPLQAFVAASIFLSKCDLRNGYTPVAQGSFLSANW